MSTVQAVTDSGTQPPRTRLVGGQLRDADPWYKQGWPWFLISFPLASVIAGVFMITLGLSTNNSLVVDDYYREGKSINQRIARDRAAALLGMQAVIEPRDGRLVLTLDRAVPNDLPAALSDEAASLAARYVPPTQIAVRWVHVTQDSKDGSTTLVPDGMGGWAASVTDWPTEGRWRLHVLPESGDWRLISDLLPLGDTAQGIVRPIPIAAQPAAHFKPGSAAN